jgi:dTDP-4-dehydrorhamnose reductase
MVWLIGNGGMLGSDVEKLLRTSKIEFIETDLEVDISDYRSLEDFSRGKKVDWIVNCAAYTNVDAAEDEQELAFRINADGPRNLARIAEKLNAKLIHISTDYVFDGMKENAYTEEDQPNPQCVYGESKLAGEKGVQDILTDYFILRTAWLYGMNGKNFVSTMLRLFGERDEISVVADQWGSPTYTRDLAEAIVTILKGDSNSFGIYHFTNEGRTHWLNFAQHIYDVAKRHDLVERTVVLHPITTEEYPTRAKRPGNSYLSKEKFKNTFHYAIPLWEEALERYFNETVTTDRTNA